MPSAPSPSLYFIWSPKTALVKIGSTCGSAASRMRELQGGHCCDCADSYEVANEFPKAGGYEQELHRAFASARRRGEWFAITAALQVLMAGHVTLGSFVREQRRAFRIYLRKEQRARRRAS
jgi:hypothetical protein